MFSCLSSEPEAHNEPLGSPVATPVNIANGPMIDPVSFRFCATESSCIVDFHQWWRWTTPHSGYSLGDGGTYRVEIQSDNSGVPSGVTLGNSFIYDPDLIANPQGLIDVSQFDGPCVNQGEIYHVVITNVHPDRFSNYISFNGAHFPSLQPDYLTSRPCEDYLKTLYFHSLGGAPQAWIDYPNSSTPDTVYMNHWTVGYSNGRFDGEEMQYGHLQTSQPIVSGGNQVRTQYIFEQSRSVNKFYFYAKRNSGSDDLSVSINGVLTNINILSNSYSWHCIPYSNTINSNTQYDVVFSSPSTSEFSVSGGQRALWRPTRHFTGLAELSIDSGASWQDWGHPWRIINAYFK